MRDGPQTRSEKPTTTATITSKCAVQSHQKNKQKKVEIAVRIVADAVGRPGVVPVKAVDELAGPDLIEHVRVDEPLAKGLAVDDRGAAVVEDVEA